MSCDGSLIEQVLQWIQLFTMISKRNREPVKSVGTHFCELI